MARKLNGIELTRYDDLFKTDAEREADQQERVQIVPAEQVFPYARQPYSVDRPSADLVRLMDSIERTGIAEPLIVRPRSEGGYEIISGHRRDYCAKVVGLDTRPVIVRDYSDEDADILVVDYNINRENLLPSEKARAYKLKLDAMKRSAGRPAKNSAQVGQNFEGRFSVEILAEQVNESRMQIQRYGVNAVSRNLIICNRDAMLNGHGLYTGVSGSGKSMMAKQEIGFVALNTDHDIIVVDPEREYGPLIRALGGEVITISASNGSYVNALDISKEYGDGRNPLVLKSEFIMSLCEQLMGAGEIGAKEKSIIDRCTANIYRKNIHKYEGDPPTLKDLYDDLMRQKEPVAHEIALALELFTTGSLNVFAHQTNIDTRNRITCYDIQDLGENLKPIGLLVMLDSILNRVIRNRQQGRYTHVYIDEIYLFFASPGVGGKSAINNYSSEFLYKCWKRFRKYYATLAGITQNVEECLLSDTARLMFANSEFLVLLNQAPTDRAELAKLLDASDAQMDYVSDAPAGHGLIKVGSCLVPFINELPRDTELYRLMTTKPGEQNA